MARICEIDILNLAKCDRTRVDIPRRSAVHAVEDGGNAAVRTKCIVGCAACLQVVASSWCQCYRARTECLPRNRPGPAGVFRDKKIAGSFAARSIADIVSPNRTSVRCLDWLIAKIRVRTTEGLMEIRPELSGVRAKQRSDTFRSLRRKNPGRTIQIQGLDLRRCRHHPLRCQYIVLGTVIRLAGVGRDLQIHKS